MNQISYDLARLRLNGLITRIPGTNTYRLTGDGLRFAIFYTKLHDRLLRPLLAADHHPHHADYAQPCAPSTVTSRLHRPRPPPKRRLKTQDQRQSSEHIAGLAVPPHHPGHLGAGGPPCRTGTPPASIPPADQANPGAPPLGPPQARSSPGYAAGRE